MSDLSNLKVGDKLLIRFFSKLHLVTIESETPGRFKTDKGDSVMKKSGKVIGYYEVYAYPFDDADAQREWKQYNIKRCKRDLRDALVAVLDNADPLYALAMADYLYEKGFSAARVTHYAEELRKALNA